MKHEPLNMSRGSAGYLPLQPSRQNRELERGKYWQRPEMLGRLTKLPYITQRYNTVFCAP
jgi:hypothetical protein